MLQLRGHLLTPMKPPAQVSAHARKVKDKKTHAFGMECAKEGRCWRSDESTYAVHDATFGNWVKLRSSNRDGR
uniref:Secreted protein n=1 Tax=Panagrellus redivivus TaxID=6233 RepID=A0A7E4W3D5_PANRE